MRRRLLMLASTPAAATETEAGASDFTTGFAVGASLAGIAAAIYAVRKYQSVKTND